MPVFHVPTREPFLDPRTGMVNERWLDLINNLNQALSAVGSIVDGLDFTDIAGAIVLAQLVAHKTTHQSGGTDAIKLDDLSAPDDNTDLNATVGAHGLLPKLSGNAAHTLKGDGTWS